jgi:hypothetical protein
VPFSSARKWSTASFAGHGAWVLGAPEMVLPDSQDGLLSQAADLAASGRRVLALAHADSPLNGQALPSGLQAVALLLLAERLRSDAPDTTGPARNPDPESALDAASALITQVNGMEQKWQSAAAETEAAVRGWWARQQR